MKRVVLFMLASAAALPLSAGYASKQLVIPLVSRQQLADNRSESSTLWLTNPSDRKANVSMMFLRATPHGNPSPSHMQLQLAAHETRFFEDVGKEVLGTDHATGALLLRADREILGGIRVSTRTGDEPVSRSVGTSFNGLPVEHAVGKGDSVVVQGATTATDLQYTLRVVETEGKPLDYLVALVDASGRIVATKRAYIAPRAVVVTKLREDFPGIDLTHGLLRITAFQGHGRVVAAGMLVAPESGDATTFEMSLVTQPRPGLPTGELAAYLAVAGALGVALLRVRA